MVINRTILLGLVTLAACDNAVESDKPCRLTQSGWLCVDASTPDLGVADATIDTNTAVDAADVLDAQADVVTPEPDAEIDVAPDAPDPIPVATSCTVLRDRGESTGAHIIDRGGREVQVWCDMDVQGGGWMLVGRSAAAGGEPFGWRSAAGAVDNFNVPYSLGEVDFPFTEMLIGNVANQNTLGDRVYRIGAPEDFWNACATVQCPVTVAVVAGACNNVVMFNRVGFNTSTNRFWFRDAVEDFTYGLIPTGISTYFDDCLGGEVNGQQGLLFVR